MKMAEKKSKAEKPMTDEEASKFATEQATPSKEKAGAVEEFEKALEAAREAGLNVSGQFSFMEDNVSHNRTF